LIIDGAIGKWRAAPMRPKLIRPMKIKFDLWMSETMSTSKTAARTGYPASVGGFSYTDGALPAGKTTGRKNGTEPKKLNPHPALANITRPPTPPKVGGNPPGQGTQLKASGSGKREPRAPVGQFSPPMAMPSKKDLSIAERVGSQFSSLKHWVQEHTADKRKERRGVFVPD
jgi:hypothetical protein